MADEEEDEENDEEEEEDEVEEGSADEVEEVVLSGNIVQISWFKIWSIFMIEEARDFGFS